jgi:tRNA threonylcarbamoyladenosine biosynthesis protein TsaE
MSDQARATGRAQPWRRDFAAASAEETASLAAALALALRPGDVVALKGDLGAGKTTFARGLIAALAAEAGQAPPEVPSPTFTLVQTYDFPRATIWHFDLFRIERPEDALELGLDEALGDGIALIEWPERLGALLPQGRIEVAIDFSSEPEARRIALSAPDASAARIAHAFAA